MWKVANSSCLKRKERVILEQQTKMPHHTKVANNRQDSSHVDTQDSGYDKWFSEGLSWGRKDSTDALAGWNCCMWVLGN